MDSGMIGKIQKAKKYAQERDRIHFEAFKVRFDGANNPHFISYEKGAWHCDCEFFLVHHKCSHTMAMEMVLEPMIS